MTDRSLSIILPLLAEPGVTPPPPQEINYYVDRAGNQYVDRDGNPYIQRPT